MRKLLMLMLMVSLFSIVFSEEIDLAQSIELAKKNNKELQAENFAVSSAKWGKIDALSNFLPRVSFNSTAVRIDDDTYDEAMQIMQVPVLDPLGMPTGNYIPFSSAALGTGFYKTSYTNSITVQQPVFNGGKMIVGYQMASLNNKQAEMQLENKNLDTSYNVATTYFGYLKLKDMHELTQKSLSSITSHLKMIEQKYEVGSAKRSDVLQWRVKKNNAKTSIFQLDNNLEEVLAYWENLIGVEDKLPSKIDLEQFDEEINNYAEMQTSELEKVKDDFMNKVATESPTLNIMNLVNKMVKKNYCRARGNFLPSLNLQFDYQIESDDDFDLSGDDNWNLVAAASVPLFTSGSNFSKVRQAKYELLKTNKQTEYNRDNYLIAAENAFNKLITNAIVVDDKRIAFDLAKENHQIINELFQQGMVTNSELLDAETMLFGSEMDMISAYYDYIITKFEIKKYTGEMEE